MPRSSIQGAAGNLQGTFPQGSGVLAVSLVGVLVNLAVAAPAGAVGVTVVGAAANVTLAAPAGLVGQGMAGSTAVGFAIAAPAGVIGNIVLGAAAPVALAAPAGQVGQGVPGVVTGMTLAAPAGLLGVAKQGVAANLALGAPAGLVGINKLGVVANLAFAAPAGVASSGIAGVVANLALRAPAGTLPTGIAGAAADLAVAAPAGQFVSNAATIVVGPTANLALGAAAGSLFNDFAVTISNTLVDASGVPLVDVSAVIRPYPPEAVRLADGSEVAAVRVSTDLSGTWFARLEQTANMTPGTFYVVDEGVPGDPRQWEFFVDGTPGTLYQHLVHPPVHQVAPGAPLDVTVGTFGPTIVTVTWARPAFNGNTPILTYTIVGIDGTTKTVTAASTVQNDGTYAAFLSGVPAQFNWTATITATNSIGTGPPSLQSNPITVGNPPAPIVVGGSPADLAVAAPAGQLSVQGVTDTHIFAPAANMAVVALVGTFPGSVAGPAANVQVGAWPGTISNPVSGAVPSAPTGVVGVAGSNADIVVSWTASGTNGGSPITGYDVAPEPGGLPVPAGLVLSTDMTGLTEGVAYQFAVAATNANGDSKMSVPSSPVVAQRPPDPPTNVAAVVVPSFVQITWNASAGLHGSVPTHYTLTILPPSGGGSATTVFGNQTVQIPLSILTVGATYSWSVVLGSSAGNSAAAVSNTITVPQPTLPDPPTQPSAAAVGSGTVSVKWHPPTRDGGSPITGYKVVASNGTTGNVPATSTTATFSGLTDGTAYTFSIYTVTGVGASPTPAVTNPASPPGNANTTISAPTAPLAVAAGPGAIANGTPGARFVFGVPAKATMSAAAGTYALTVPGPDPAVGVAAPNGTIANGLTIGAPGGFPTANLAVAAPAGLLSNPGAGSTAIVGVNTGMALAARAGVFGQSMLGAAAPIALAAPAGTIVNPTSPSVTVIGPVSKMTWNAVNGHVGITLVGLTASVTLFAPSGDFNGGQLGRSIRRALFAEEGGGNLTTADYQHHEVVVMQPTEGDPVAANAANPTILVYQYTTGVHSVPNTPDVIGQNGFNPDNPPQPNNPDSWWLYDAAGNQCCRPAPFNTILHMNPRSSGWRAYYAAKVKAMCTDGAANAWMSGSAAWDGPFIDTLGPFVLSDCATVASGGTVATTPAFINSSGTPVTYTNDTWLVDAAAMAGYIYTQVPNANALGGGRDAVGNGLGGVSAFGGLTAGTGTKLLYDQPLFTVLAENFLHLPGDPVTPFPTRATIVAAIAEINYVTVTLGCNFFADCKVWLSGLTQTQIDTWQRIFIATVLLGHNGYNSSALAYEVGSGADRTVYPFFSATMGDPTAAATGMSGSGTISRAYEGGLILYSPGAAGSFTLSSSSTWTDVDGTVYAGAVTVPADFPLILTSSASAVTPTASLAAAATRRYGTGGAISPIMVGAAGEGWRSSGTAGLWFDVNGGVVTINAGFKAAAIASKVNFLRSPGGTAVDYWNWQTGKTELSSGSAGTVDPGLPVVGGALPNNGFTIQRWLDVCVAMGVEPLVEFNTCMVTSNVASGGAAYFIRGVSGTTAQFQADVALLVQDNIQMLTTAIAYMRAKGTVGGIDYSNWYPKAIEMGNEIYLNGATKSAGPAAAFGGGSSGGALYAYLAYQMANAIRTKAAWSTWAPKSATNPVRIFACGTPGSFQHAWQNALCAFTDSASGNALSHVVDGYTMHGEYWNTPASTPATNADLYSAVNIAVAKVATNGYVTSVPTSGNNTQLPAGMTIAYTEYNYTPDSPSTGGPSPIANIWAQGLGMAAATLAQIDEPEVEMTCAQAFVGAGGSSYARIANNTLQPWGIAVAMLCQASAGASAYRKIDFTTGAMGAGTLVAGQGMMGAAFQTSTGWNAYILNTDSSAHTINFAATSPLGGNFTGFQITAAFTATSVSQTAISGTGTSITIPRFSVTRITVPS